MPSGNNLGSWDGELRAMRHESESLRHRLIVGVPSGEVNCLWLAAGSVRLLFMHFNYLGLPVRGPPRVSRRP
jgi:hypothetical protein